MEGVRLVFIILTIVCICRSAISRAHDEPEATQGPVMLSQPSNLKVTSGDTVLLPCVVKDIGRSVRLWKQLPSNILFSGSIVVSRDPKVSLANDSLQITKITPDYSGEYVCQVSKHLYLSVSHRIQVQVPPTLSPDPPEGKVTFRKGESASIFCNAHGIPQPHITWTYGDDETQASGLPTGVRQVQGSQLHIPSVDVHHSGVYLCIAENNVGQPAVATFRVNVQYAPELSVKPDWIHGDEGANVEFVCTSKSYPPAYVMWLKGGPKRGQEVHISDRARLLHRQLHPNVQEVVLRFQQLTRDDLGPYTCTARNPAGKAWKTVEISGLAEPAVLRGTPSGEGSYLMKWSAKSFSPVIEYMLKIRKHMSGDQWVDVVIPASSEEGQSLLYSQSYNVTGLEPGTRYEAVLQAHNAFGWNRPSDTLFFGEEIPSPDLEIEDVVKAEPPTLPLYEAELDVTDPTYLKQSSKSSYLATNPALLISILFLLYISLTSN